LLALGKTPIIEDEKLFIEPNDWFVPIKNSYSALKKEYARLELSKKPDITAQTEALSSIRTRWLPR
ncbi:MAG: hypothetical protein COY81_03515, partial [Candidatus Pacebacteria bacterium CG_4_10_14_0_8_um_filter_43_12]